MVELAFEGHRYPDLRTWMIAEEEMNEPYYTRNVAATSYESSWERTKDVFPGKRSFQAKHYFFPIQQKQLSEMINITQNYGWQYLLNNTENDEKLYILLCSSVDTFPDEWMSKG